MPLVSTVLLSLNTVTGSQAFEGLKNLGFGEGMLIGLSLAGAGLGLLRRQNSHKNIPSPAPNISQSSSPEPQRLELETKLLKLQQHERQLELELDTKVSLVSELAHRSNNPLQASDLGILNITDDNTTLKDLTQKLFGDPAQLDPDGKLCFDTYMSAFDRILAECKNVRDQLHRVAQAIYEIRILSGVDGHSLDYIDLVDSLQKTHQRLAETAGLQALDRLTMNWSGVHGLRIATHPAVLPIALERIFRQWLHESKEPLHLTIVECSEQNEIVFELNQRESRELSAENQHLVELLNHILYPHRLTLAIDLQAWQLKLTHYPVVEQLTIPESTGSTEGS